MAPSLPFQIIQRPGQPDLKLQMRDLSKAVAQSVSELCRSAEALKGRILVKFDHTIDKPKLITKCNELSTVTMVNLAM